MMGPPLGGSPRVRAKAAQGVFTQNTLRTCNDQAEASFRTRGCELEANQTKRRILLDGRFPQELPENFTLSSSQLPVTNRLCKAE